MHMKWTDLLSILGPQVDLNRKIMDIIIYIYINLLYVKKISDIFYSTVHW